MNLTDDLRKLSDLHEEGRLTDQEFADAKRRTLAASPAEWSAPPASGKAAAEAMLRIEARCYKSSRWSSGNLFFPDRLTLSNDGILFRKGAMFGSSEEHISYRAIASFRTRNGIFLSTVFIETSGGSQPIIVNGLWRSRAKEIMDTIRTFQS